MESSDSRPSSSPMASWPWQWSGPYKYLLYLPLACQALLSSYNGEAQLLHHPCFHVLLLSLLRCVLYETCHYVSRLHYTSWKHRIQASLVDFKQVDREFDWDNYVILQASIAFLVLSSCPGIFSTLPSFDWRGFMLVLVVHAGLSELLYYFIHRSFHRISYLYNGYHYFHHLSIRPEPSTAGSATFLEHLLLTLVMSLPLISVLITESASLSVLYAYVLAFDLIRFIIHSNIELVPVWPFKVMPFLRYLLITPSYHSLHHEHGNANYCLFMPLYDYLGGTIDSAAFKTHEEIRIKGRKETIPDSVFVAHGVDFVSALHVGFVGRTFSSYPRNGWTWYAQIFTPIVFILLWIPWAWGKIYAVSQYTIHGINQQVWSTPLLGFQYFLPNAFKKVNRLLEEAILEADRKGVKVLTLGALNKNEVMNGGGLLFVNKFKDLKVRICHGNTLTTAVILHELPENVEEVFLTGSTSKIGKAIALYLCRKRVRVLMLTASEERFNAVVKEASRDCQKYLVRATKYQAGQNCKTWIIGKWAGYTAQKLAPEGTHFHQFTLPPILHLRNDCTYHDSAGMLLPRNFVQGLNTCEHTMPRYVIHACHVGGLVHALEGWKHHEVGAVDVDMLDVVWNAALKHGFRRA